MAPVGQRFTQMRAQSIARENGIQRTQCPGSAFFRGNWIQSDTPGDTPTRGMALQGEGKVEPGTGAAGAHMHDARNLIEARGNSAADTGDFVTPRGRPHLVAN